MDRQDEVKIQNNPASTVKPETPALMVGPQPRRLSDELAKLVEGFAERPVTLREVVTVLRGRAYTLLLIFLALPFCTPIPIPGLSTVLGLVIALIGFRLSLRQKPWLPAKLLDTALPPRFFVTMLSAGRWILRALEWGAKPRWIALVEQPLLQHAYGVMILVSGLLLLLPLPIPFSNFLPSIVIILTAMTLLERDGYCAILAFIAFILTLCFFASLVFFGTEGFIHLKSWLNHS
jgi:hypothetical protein